MPGFVYTTFFLRDGGAPHGFCKCISHKIFKKFIDIIELPDWLIIPVTHLCPLGKGKLARLYKSRTIEGKLMNVVVALNDF
jgi:hypothetical protein